LNKSSVTFTVFLFAFLFNSCANQLPPSGGKDDTDPPQIIYIFPKPNSTNIKGNSIVFKFNEYVDRRSFEESFYISPAKGNTYSFDWSGKEVELTFNKNFDREKTYVIVIGKDFKDVRGGNKITSPVQFAFSTGSKLDSGKLSGKIFSDSYDRVKVMAYFNKDETGGFPDPAKSLPDYITQVTPDGIYEFTNLPEGRFRIYAIRDEDRNNLYSGEPDKIALLPEDIKLSGDSNFVSNLNFILNLPGNDVRSPAFLKSLKPDSADHIYTNKNDNNNFIIPGHRFYFYFKNKTPDKKNIVDNFKIADTATGKIYKPVFNWINDSLLEVFTLETPEYNSVISVSVDLSETDLKYRYKVYYKVYGREKFGKISGRIDISEFIYPVVIKLYDLSDKNVSYGTVLTDTSGFSIDNILEGKYLLFAFIDENSDGEFYRGNVFPFKPPEKYIIYDNDFEIKGNSVKENIILGF